MAQTVKGTIGDQPVELINAATEATLAAMLAIAKQDSAVLRAMAQKANVDSKAIEKASKAMEENSKQAGSAGNSLGETASKASLLGGFLLDMGSATMKTMSNLVNFGDELLEGKARASDLFKAFKDLPLGLGLLASLFEKVMKYQEKNLDIYQAISGTGAGLNGSLAGLRTQAASLYLTMDELANMYKKNGDVLQQLGGSATSGSAALLGINRNLQRNFGPELSKLGYTFSEINDLLGNYLRVSNDGMRADKDSASEQERLAKAAANYGKELDYMSRLTGEGREALEKKMQAEAAEASWQAHLASLEPKEREKANMALMRANSIGGKGAMDALKASIMGFAAPFTEEGRTFVSMFGQGTQAVEGLAKSVKDGTSIEVAKTTMNKLQAAGIAGVIKDMKGYGNIVAAAGQGGTEAAKGLMEIQGIVNKYTASGKVNQEQIEKEIAQVIEKTEKDKKAADAAVATERRMKELSNQINQALLPIMDLLAKHANTLVTKFSDFIKEVDFKKLGTEISNFMEAVINYTKNLFSEEGRTKIMNDIKYWFKLLLIELKQALIPWYTESDAEEERRRLDGDKKIVDARADAAKDLIERENLTKRLELLKDKNAVETLQKEIDADKAKVEALNKNKELTDLQKKDLADIEARMKDNENKKNIIEKMSEKERAAAIDGIETKLKNASQNVKVATQQTSGEQKVANREAMNQSMQENMSMGMAYFDNGTVGSKNGNILQDFGTESLAKLHKREAVLNESQLTNLAKGTAETGAAQAQIALANELATLNKQQAMTNQLLARSVEMQQKIAESQPVWAGNRFARVA